MSGPAFSPGPWRVSCVRTRLAGHPVLQILAADGKWYSTVFYSDKTPEEHRTSYADAYLIAAAPELLWVAQRTLAMVEEGAGPPDWDWIRAVIAKAKGGPTPFPSDPLRDDEEVNMIPAERRPGKSRLIYDKARRTIINEATGEPALSTQEAGDLNESGHCHRSGLGGWQPIETAPKDGSTITVRNHLIEPVLAKWGGYSSPWGNPSKEWVLVKDSTEFMPLPAGTLVIPTEWLPEPNPSPEITHERE